MSDHPFYMDLLVLFSIVIACLSSFIAVDLAERMVRYKRSVFFVLFSSCALGTGMWSMHYISMIAMKHESTASYYIPMLLLSLFVPIAASYVLLLLFNNPRTRSSKATLGFGGLLFSCGLLIMHCSGMMSVRYTAAFEQSAGSVLGSLVLSLAVPAITASYHPNWTAKRYNMFSAKKLLLILVLTAVLSGTNYIAMAGASYVDTGPYIYMGRTPLLNDSMLGMILARSLIHI
ncbi:hypothetical protein AMQ83_18960 [Paenibacillus riograndensis]|nr:hypothetical protein AMQ83_18960 [Paenibacillus riograndensis]